MKVSVSLPAEDVEFIDEYARGRLLSRSRALRDAIAMLRQRDLADEYEAAYDEWAASEDAADWEATTGDGIAA